MIFQLFIILAIVFLIIGGWLLAKGQRNGFHTLCRKVADETKFQTEVNLDLIGKIAYVAQEVARIGEQVNTISKDQKEEPIPKKGANRRPRSEAEKAQQAQIKKDWWAKKKAQEQNTPTPEAATSAKTPS